MGFDVEAARQALSAELAAQRLDPNWNGEISEAHVVRMAEINAELFRQRKQAAYRKSKYGVNNALYAAMNKRQNGCCATCKRPASMFKRGLVIDQNHDTGHVRGLLCSPCNTILGHAQESPETLHALADYLQLHAQK